MQGRSPQVCGCRKASVTTWPLCCEITVRVGGRRWDDKVMLHDEEDDEFRVGSNFPPPLYSSYLLVFGVLRSEVAAHQLEFNVEMRQPVEKVHPPRWGVVHYGRHPDAGLPAGCTLHSITRFLTQTLRRDSRPTSVTQEMNSCTVHTSFHGCGRNGKRLRSA